MTNNNIYLEPFRLQSHAIFLELCRELDGRTLFISPDAPKLDDISDISAKISNELPKQYRQVSFLYIVHISLNCRYDVEILIFLLAKVSPFDQPSWAVFFPSIFSLLSIYCDFIRQQRTTEWLWNFPMILIRHHSVRVGFPFFCQFWQHTR